MRPETIELDNSVCALIAQASVVDQHTKVSFNRVREPTESRRVERQKITIKFHKMFTFSFTCDTQLVLHSRSSMYWCVRVRALSLCVCVCVCCRRWLATGEFVPIQHTRAQNECITIFARAEQCLRCEWLTRNCTLKFVIPFSVRPLTAPSRETNGTNPNIITFFYSFKVLTEFRCKTFSFAFFSLPCIWKCNLREVRQSEDCIKYEWARVSLFFFCLSRPNAKWE